MLNRLDRFCFLVIQELEWACEVYANYASHHEVILVMKAAAGNASGILVLNKFILRSNLFFK